jgi:outer membrane protein insertion porin family
MTFLRPRGLRAIALYLCAFPLLAQQDAPPPAQPAKPEAQPPKPQAPRPANPFENVPQSTPPQVEQPKPAPPKLETPVAPAQPQPPNQPVPAPAANANVPPEDVIESVEFRGARRVPQDTLRAMIFTKRGDKYDEDALHRDFMTLWNTSRFDDIRMEREAGRMGWIVRFVVVERRVVRSIKYDGLKSIQVSEVLDRFKERKVGLSVESQYDPNKLQRAKVVLQEYLAERGRQFATVEPDLHQVPPSSLEITFKVDEGPKVKVGQITFEGNKAFSPLVIRRAMHNLRPIGIPQSILLENMFAKTYDATKLEEDEQRIQQFYQDHGYFVAHTTGQEVKIVDVGGGHFRLPLIRSNRVGKDADIKIDIEEGRVYHLNMINFVGVKLFRTPETLMRPIFGMQTGDVFSTGKLRKGFEDLRKLYGQFGYIDFVAEPDFEPQPNSDKINLTLNFDEGKQFFVRRIDFSGNTTTRDKVIRRQLLVDEGDIFNTRMWELSLLRLNQLGYFEVLKEDQAADIKRDTKTDTVDITLKVKERGKNTIQLSGGVSGISGSFVGASYSTNNFLGLGETLSLTSQVGTRTQNAQLGFTEPYLFDRPLQAGFTVYVSRFNYNQAREASILSGANLIPLYAGLGAQNLLNYVTDSHGFTTFASYPLKRAFARFGITYGYDISNVKTLTTAASDYYDYLNFLRINGPNPLSGITTSAITPNYTYNSVNHPITPSAGKSISISVKFAGSFLGGNVNEIMPQVDARYFRKGLKPGHVIGMHFLGRYLTGYGGKVAPPMNRFYMGGENDIRGFELWGVSPIVYVPTSGTVNVLNTDGSPRQQKTLDPTTGAVSLANVTQTIPAYQMVFPGGNTSLVGNFEYRIPIVGPVTLAYFVDAGINKLTNTSQLELNPSRISQLDGQFPEAAFGNKAVIAPGTQAMRMSTGLELQVLMPVVNAPFRVYFAYNPMRVVDNLQPPIVADRTYFTNQATFANSVATFGQAIPFDERRTLFRFTVGRTF